MNEEYLVGEQKKACKERMPFGLFWKHNDSNAGYPDVSFAWTGMCSWWEFKFWNEGDFESYVQQEIMCKKLSQQCPCYYVIFEVRKGVKHTYIVGPFQLDVWDTLYAARYPGFAYDEVSLFMANIHLGIK